MSVGGAETTSCQQRWYGQSKSKISAYALRDLPVHYYRIWKELRIWEQIHIFNRYSNKRKETKCLPSTNHFHMPGVFSFTSSTACCFALHPSTPPPKPFENCEARKNTHLYQEVMQYLAHCLVGNNSLMGGFPWWSMLLSISDYLRNAWRWGREVPLRFVYSLIDTWWPWCHLTWAWIMYKDTPVARRRSNPVSRRSKFMHASNWSSRRLGPFGDASNNIFTISGLFLRRWRICTADKIRDLQIKRYAEWV